MYQHVRIPCGLRTDATHKALAHPDRRHVHADSRGRGGAFDLVPGSREVDEVASGGVEEFRMHEPGFARRALAAARAVMPA